MDFVMLWKSAVLGLVEGLTEFLPISSTGHLIIVEDLLNVSGQEKWAAFAIFVQLGAILAVCWEYRARLAREIWGLRSQRSSWQFALNLAVAFLPAGVVGLLCHHAIKKYLFSPLNGPVIVADALIIGGVIILWVESRPGTVTVDCVEQITWRQALVVGLAQVLAMIPGTSRSGATIIGGLLAGMHRKTATEFSFFLAIPTMFAATLYEMYKSRDAFAAGDIGPFAVGFAVAFMSALLAVRVLIRYVSRHDLKAFAWYRFGLGAAVLVYAWFSSVSGS